MYYLVGFGLGVAVLLIVVLMPLLVRLYMKIERVGEDQRRDV